MYVHFLRIFQTLVVIVSCLSVKSTTIYNNAISSPFAKPYQSPFTQGVGINQGVGVSPVGMGIRRAINTAYSPLNTFGAGDSLLKRRCPLCDSSVYGYCSEKLFHDSCCCHNPNNPYDELPYQCQFADCSFLHANSCREHKLITACCCTNFLLYRK